MRSIFLFIAILANASLAQIPPVSTPTFAFPAAPVVASSSPVATPAPVAMSTVPNVSAAPVGDDSTATFLPSDSVTGSPISANGMAPISSHAPVAAKSFTSSGGRFLIGTTALGGLAMVILILL